MAFGETVECLARNEVQGDLSFELDAMGAVRWDLAVRPVAVRRDPLDRTLFADEKQQRCFR